MKTKFKSLKKKLRSKLIEKLSEVQNINLMISMRTKYWCWRRVRMIYSWRVLKKWRHLLYLRDRIPSSENYSALSEHRSILKIHHLSKNKSTQMKINKYGMMISSWSFWRIDSTQKLTTFTILYVQTSIKWDSYRLFRRWIWPTRRKWKERLRWINVCN